MKGSVYFIEAIGVNLVKIGFTTRGFVSQRVRELQTGNPFKLEELASVEAFKGDEKRAHAKFARQHHLNEWFVLDDTLRAWIEDVKRTGKLA